MAQLIAVRSMMPAVREASSRGVVKRPRATKSVVVPAGVCGRHTRTRSASVTATESAAAKTRESVVPSCKTLGWS